MPGSAEMNITPRVARMQASHGLTFPCRVPTKHLFERRWAAGAICCSILSLLACPKGTPAEGSAESGASDGNDNSGPIKAGSGDTRDDVDGDDESNDDVDGPGPVLGGGGSGGEEPGGDDNGDAREGELVVVAFDSSTRSVGTQRIVFHGDKVFWTQEKDETLSIFSASLSGPLPAQPQTILQHPWVPSSGWSNPPLLVTDTHIMLPIMGSIDVGSGFIDTSGFATLRHDGSDLQLARFQEWWLAGHGPNAILPAEPDAEDSSPRELNLGTGASTPLPEYIPGEECIYDPVRDERACVWYGQLNVYSFATKTAKQIVESLSIQYDTFGTPRLSYNSTHWFVAHALGVAAYPREGGGSPRFYRSIDGAAESFLTDDQFAYVCLDNDLVRVSLADETHETLTDGDCESQFGLGSVLWLDASYVYYLGERDIDYGARPSDIRRIARTAPGKPRAVADSGGEQP